MTEHNDSLRSADEAWDVTLEQYNPAKRRSELEESLIDEVFRSLMRTSADVASTSEPTIHSFQERCLYFATIHDASVDNLGNGGGKGHAAKAPVERCTAMYTAGGVQRRPRIPASEVQPFWQVIPQLFNATSQASSWHTESNLFGYIPNENLCNTNVLDEDTPMLGDTHDEWEALDKPAPDRLAQTFAGIIYLLASSKYPSEVSLGLALLSAHTNKGIGPCTVLKALELAFDVFTFHRVSAAVLDSPPREHALRMFVALGFSHEGVHRRGIMSSGPGQCESTWRDVHNLALLDTDWAMMGGAKSLSDMLEVEAALKRKALANTSGENSRAEEDQNMDKGKTKESTKRTRWDEMLSRHQREREELLGFEERSRVLRRTLSTETLRPSGISALDSAANTSASEAETSDAESSNAGNSVRRSASPVPSASTNPGQDPFASPEDPAHAFHQQSLIASQLNSGANNGVTQESMREMITSWRASAYSAAHGQQSDSDVDSESEMHSLLPGMRRRAPWRSMPQVRAVPIVGPRNHAILPPDLDAHSDAESTCPSVPESSNDQYTSCEEESSEEDEGNAILEADHGPEDNLSSVPSSNTVADHTDPGSSTVLSRLPSGLPTSNPASTYTSDIPDPLLGLLPSPKRRRVGEANASSSVPVDAPVLDISSFSAAFTPVDEHTVSDPSTTSAPMAVLDSLPQQDQHHNVSPSPPPSLSYRLSMTEIRNPHEDAMDSDVELERTWDILSTASESESSVSSGTSLSLQSASDTESDADGE